MPKASEVANELRKFAEALDATPDANVKLAMLSFYSDTKEQFVNAAKVMIRPFVKSEDDYGHESYRRIHLRHATDALIVDVNVYKSLTCELVEPARPAVYRCDPILSLAEEAEVSR